METRQRPLGTGFDTNTTADEVISGLSLDSKGVIVTGGHSGLGLETTRALSNAGAKIVVCFRDVQRASAAVSALKNAEVVHCGSCGDDRRSAQCRVPANPRRSQICTHSLVHRCARCLLGSKRVQGCVLHRGRRLHCRHQTVVPSNHHVTCGGSEE